MGVKDMARESGFVEYDDVRALMEMGPGEGILSVYADSPPERRHEGEIWQTILNSGLTQLAQKYPTDKRLARTIEAAVSEIRGLERDARFRSLVYFRSIDPDWSWWRSVQGSVGTQFYWGRRPALFPLIAYLHREPAIGVFLVSQEAVQCFTWRQSVLTDVERWELELDTEDWRTYAARTYPQPMRGRETVTQTERFRRRLYEAMQRQFASLAPRIAEIGKADKWEAIMVFGASEIRDMFIDALDESWQKKVIEGTDRHFAIVDVKELNETVAEEVAAWRERTDRQEMATLLNSLGAGKKGVVGGQEVLDLLANDRVYRLFICSELRSSGYRRRDGSMSVVAGLSPLRLRITRKQLRHYTEEPNFLEEVVALALNRRVEVVPMHGTCGERLKGLGGLGAYLRY